MPLIFTGGGSVFAPSKMTKNGNWGTLSASFVMVEAWTADVGGFPGSTVFNHGLMVQGGKAGATIRAEALVSNGGNQNYNATLQLLVNDVAVYTGAAMPVGAFGGTATPFAEFTTTLNAGDRVTVAATASVAGWLTINTGTATFVRVT